VGTVFVLAIVLAGFEPQQGSTRTECFPPKVVGLTQEAASRRLGAQHMRLGSVDVATSTAPRGTIISQHPKACSDPSRDAPVDIIISNGRVSEPVGDRDGGSSIGRVVVPLAAAAIIGAVIAARRDRPDREEAPSAEPAQEPARPSPARTATVPAVTGLSWEEAQRAIAAAQLRARATNPADAANSQAVVSAQVPSAGTAVVPGATVGLTMGLPPQPSISDPVAPVPIAPLVPQPVVPQPLAPQLVLPQPVVIPPPAVVQTDVTPPAPRVPRPAPVPPAGPEPTAGVVPSRPVAFNVPVVAPVVLAAPAGTDGSDWWSVVAGAEWPWIVFALIGAIVAVVLWLRRTRVMPATVSPVAAQVLTCVPRLDAGVQQIAGSAQSRTLDVVVRLDPGIQIFRPHVAVRPIGAIS
jgi:hypothetical protein